MHTSGVFINICIGLYVCVHACMFIFIYVCMYSIYACMYVCVFVVYMHACMYVGIYVGMYVYVYIWIHVCMHVCTQAYTYICIHINTCMHARMYACVCVYPCMYLHTCMTKHDMICAGLHRILSQGARSTSNENAWIPQRAVGRWNRRIPRIPQILPKSRSTEIQRTAGFRKNLWNSWDLAIATFHSPLWDSRIFVWSRSGPLSHLLSHNP